MPALIIGANLPDIDAGCVIYGIESLGMRRGITHGPIALMVLPLLLAGALWWFDKWQERRGKRPEGRLPVRFGWLLTLSFIACLTHPLFDWFNNYGIRLLEPFSSQWFYGDTLFIIDPWIIAMLGVGIWLSLRRERVQHYWPEWPATAGLIGVLIFTSFNIGVSRLSLILNDSQFAERAVSNALPLTFWRREVLWQNRGTYGCGEFRLFGDSQTIEYDLPTNMADPRIAAWSKDDPAARAFLFWSRMPIAELHADRIVLRDQRFMDPRIGDRFTVTIRPPR